jgi:hypothetical protein
MMHFRICALQKSEMAEGGIIEFIPGKPEMVIALKMMPKEDMEGSVTTMLFFKDAVDVNFRLVARRIEALLHSSIRVCTNSFT